MDKDKKVMEPTDKKSDSSSHWGGSKSSSVHTQSQSDEIEEADEADSPS